MTVSLCLAMPTVSLKAADSDNQDIPVMSNELPSYSTLQREKRSIASNTELSALASPLRGLTRGVSDWEDPFFPGDEASGSGNVGNINAPIGDVSLPVVLLAFLIYFLYRGLTISKRRNTF